MAGWRASKKSLLKVTKKIVIVHSAQKSDTHNTIKQISFTLFYSHHSFFLKNINTMAASATATAATHTPPPVRSDASNPLTNDYIDLNY
jgi:hypothetical protein